MDKLNALIEEYCPDGIPRKKIVDITDYEQPSTYIVENTEYSDEYSIPVLTAGQSFILGYTDEESGVYPASKNNPVIIFDDFTGAFKWVDFPFKVKSSAIKMITAKESIATLRYVYHLMGFLNYSSSEHKRLWISMYSEFIVPVPPLEVQREIIRVLDSFTLLTTELTTELTARKKQSEFYREYLISSRPNVPMKKYKLKDICDIYLGLTATPTYTDEGVKFISAQNTSSDYLDLSNVKYISEQDYAKATSNAKPKRGDLLFTRVGSNLGHPVIVDTDERLCIFVSLGFLRIKNHEKAIIGYLKHWMNTELFWAQVRKNCHGAAKINLNTGWIREFEIELPNIEEQRKIVSILDSFDKIQTDFNSGIPAEIEARNKQYQYYRDEILSFSR